MKIEQKEASTGPRHVARFENYEMISGIFIVVLQVPQVTSVTHEKYVL